MQGAHINNPMHQGRGGRGAGRGAAVPVHPVQFNQPADPPQPPEDAVAGAGVPHIAGGREVLGAGRGRGAPMGRGAGHGRGAPQNVNPLGAGQPQGAIQGPPPQLAVAAGLPGMGRGAPIGRGRGNGNHDHEAGVGRGRRDR